MPKKKGHLGGGRPRSSQNDLGACLFMMVYAEQTGERRASKLAQDRCRHSRRQGRIGRERQAAARSGLA